MGVIVELTWEDLAFAEHVGQLRLRSSQSCGRNPARSQDRGRAERDLHERLGCLAEMAVARLLGREWEGTVNRFHDLPDVPPFDVRATTHPTGCLIIRDNDPAGWPYILAVGTGVAPVVDVRGWLWGREARRGCYLYDPHGKRPSWFVPQSHLRPVPAVLGRVMA
jgi:hypothetical protein